GGKGGTDERATGRLQAPEGRPKRGAQVGSTRGRQRALANREEHQRQAHLDPDERPEGELAGEEQRPDDAGAQQSLRHADQAQGTERLARLEQGLKVDEQATGQERQSGQADRTWLYCYDVTD